MRLYLIRHCQSENNALWRRTGSGEGRSADPALTELGRQQAGYLARFVAGSANHEQDTDLDRHGLRLTHLYCSLMRRSIETGLYVARLTDLPLVAREDIHERGGIYLRDPQSDFPDGLPGATPEELREDFPNLSLPEKLPQEGWWNRPYEEQEAAVIRAGSMLEWLLATHDNSNDRVAMIIHGGFIQSIFTALFHMPLLDVLPGDEREVWIKANNGSITRIDFLEDIVRLTYQNRVDFIPEHLVT
jgi:2,3-bisphosphoglycerate-dependent phosphoglycerate mutase